MKNKLPCFVLGLLSVSAVFGASSSSSSVVSVSASQAIRIVLVDTGERDHDPAGGVDQVFAPYLSETISRLHGAHADVRVVALPAAQAARALKEGRFDAALVVGARVPRGLRRSGNHVLTGESLLEARASRVFLVLRKEEARLDALMANAFTLALSDYVLRRTLVDRLNGGQAFTAVDR